MYWSFVSGWHEHASAIAAPNLRLVWLLDPEIEQKGSASADAGVGE
jgi:hypothetical protein